MASSSEGWYSLYFTPSFTLSLLVESERPTPTPWISVLSTVHSISRSILGKPSLLLESLDEELERRPLLVNEEADDGRVIGAGALRIVDNRFWSQSGKASGEPIFESELVQSLSRSESIPRDSQAYQLLGPALDRVLKTYELVDAVGARAKEQYEGKPEQEEKLREVWDRFKPDTALIGMVSKQWQELGFQGTSPSTDFRGLGLLALDSLLFFVQEFGDRAIKVLEESVDAGPNWYPLALASMHITAFTLDLATSRDLQLLLLRGLQTSPPIAVQASSDKPDLSAFLRLSAELLLLFHKHWRQADRNVMQFESVSKEFQERIRPWIRRGVMDGRGLGWETALIKLD